MSRTLTSATAYYDTQDTRNEGWAYRLRFDDGHEESGALDTTDADDGNSALAELEDLVAANDGKWRGMVTGGNVTEENGAYVWTADED